MHRKLASYAQLSANGGIFFPGFYFCTTSELLSAGPGTKDGTGERVCASEGGRRERVEREEGVARKRPWSGLLFGALAEDSNGHWVSGSKGLGPHNFEQKLS